jgi:type II secretory pathway pseudopilin PulG
MIGVLAVMAILATVIISATIKSQDVGVTRQESAALQAFATAFQNSVLRNRYIPGANGTTPWYQAIATELGTSTNSVLFNLRNPNSARVFMIDPNLSVGPSGGTLPYLQGSAGSTCPTNARVMIVSSLAPNTALPAAGVASANFTNLWNCALGALPSTGFTGWNPYDLMIQRVNLQPLFVNLQLQNYLSTNQGQYTIDTNALATVPNPNGVSACFIKGTVLGLFTNGSSLLTPNATLMLNRDDSYFYVAQVWRNAPSIPNVSLAAQTNSEAANLAEMISISASAFAASPCNIYAQNGATPQSVVNAISNFLYFYPPYAAYGAANNWPTTGSLYSNASYAQTLLGNALGYLANNITQGGCTNGP